MSASYNPSLIAPIDRLRFTLGDTNVDAPLLPDETYTALLAANGNDERKAMVAAADALISKYAQQADSVSSDGNAAAWKDRLIGWKRLADRLRVELIAEQTRARSGFDVLRPTRGGDIGGEYHAGGRVPPEGWA